MGSGSNLSIWEPQMDSRHRKKWNTSFSYYLTSNQLNKDEKSFQALNSPSTFALNTRSYMCTWVALWPPFWWRHYSDQTRNSDGRTGSNCYIWPKVYFGIGRQKLSHNLHGMPIRHRLKIWERKIQFRMNTFKQYAINVHTPLVCCYISLQQ